jgi:hypothetical protein
MCIVGQDFRRDSQAVTLTPQRNYKLDASSLTNRHINEVCIYGLSCLLRAHLSVQLIQIRFILSSLLVELSVGLKF